MSPDERARARLALEAWFAEHARDLPWRRARDPYAVWVSEVMLQQTRVETVARYFEPFLARFPTAEALAGASEDEVLAAWSGLGYYRRARALHEGARAVVERHGGLVPRDRAARLALPGIGRYTAGAIGSLAFDLPEPIVDGNVRRVLSRVHRVDDARGARAAEERLWAEASAWAKAEAPGRVNEALMELGATHCARSSPRCGACPLAPWCGAHRRGDVDAFPSPRARSSPRELHVVALDARDEEGRCLLVKTDADASIEGALFRGLWALPMREGRGRAAARALAERWGLTLLAGRARSLEHVLTHRRLLVRVYRARTAGAKAGAKLVALGALHALGVATLTKKLLALSERGSAPARP